MGGNQRAVNDRKWREHGDEKKENRRQLKRAVGTEQTLKGRVKKEKKIGRGRGMNSKMNVKIKR